MGNLCSSGWGQRSITLQTPLTIKELSKLQDGQTERCIKIRHDERFVSTAPPAGTKPHCGVRKASVVGRSCSRSIACVGKEPSLRVCASNAEPQPGTHFLQQNLQTAWEQETDGYLKNVWHIKTLVWFYGHVTTHTASEVKQGAKGEQTHTVISNHMLQ